MLRKGFSSRFMIFSPAGGEEDGKEARYQVETQHSYCLGAVLQSYTKYGFCEAK